MPDTPDAILTLPERKAREAERRAAAVVAVSERLAAHARANGGRYLVYGSAARGEMRFDSDFDLVLDFPEDREADAWRFAEDVCAAERLPVDIRPLGWCSARFLAHVEAEWRQLS